jgi:hypothetical protein
MYIDSNNKAGYHVKKFRKLFTAFISTTVLQAKDASIPVILTDRNVDADSSLYKTMIGSDFVSSLEQGNSAFNFLILSGHFKGGLP